MDRLNLYSPFHTHIPNTDALTFRAIQGDSKVALTKVGTPYLNTFYYKRNGLNSWTYYNLGDYIDLSFGQTVSFSGTSLHFNTTCEYGTVTNYYNFQTSGGRLDIEGNINSLINGKNELTDLKEFAFIFSGCSQIINAKNLLLPFEVLQPSCYYCMFQRCYNLISVPILSSTTLARGCYMDMFNRCNKLKQLPQLPATEVKSLCYREMFAFDAIEEIPLNYLPATKVKDQCYLWMFNANPLLRSVPLNLLPATTLDNYCYQQMFSNCTSLTSVPKLPATTLKSYCYREMFANCTSLSTIPLNMLPAIELANNCYYAMFSGCTNLTSVSLDLLPATELADGCYLSMFYYCNSLSTPLILPATELKHRCYYSMFVNCFALTTLPALPATKLADSCYAGMFKSCRFSTLPINYLPATTLDYGCYNSMFYNCKLLTAAPFLPATELKDKCYWYMFSGCTKLTSLSVNFTSWNLDLSATLDWVDGVSNTGTFYKPYALSTVKDVSHIPTNWNVLLNLNITDNDCLTFKSNGDTTVCLSAIETVLNLELDPILLQYKRNNGVWTNYTINTAISLANGDEVRFSGANDCTFCKRYDTGTCRCNYNFVTTGTGTINVYGKLISLINFNKVLKYEWQFCALFMSSCKNIVDISQLLFPPTVSQKCYAMMFLGCTNLSSVPILPATTLAPQCYWNMFLYDRALSTVPDNMLPATEMDTNCYGNMFRGCKSLTDTPKLLATSLKDGYSNYTSYSSMFTNCTSLTSITINFTEWPEEGCINWVSGVAPTGIFNCPYPLDRISDLNHIPCGWIIKDRATWMMSGDPLTFISKGNTTVSLIKVGLPDPIEMYYSKNGEGPELYTIGLNISLGDGDYLSFKGTTEFFNRYGESLSSEYYYYNFRTAGTGTLRLRGRCNSLINYSNNMPSAGTFSHLFEDCKNITNASNFTLPSTEFTNYCYANMFAGCRSLTAIPLLPVTTLAQGCYLKMFENCTSLITAPLLPATTLTNRCYYGMFHNCTSLSSVPLLPAITIAPSCYAYLFAGCESLKTIPENYLSITKLYNRSYIGMFSGCTNLLSIPLNLLPANKLAKACYNSMFAGCTSLTSTPILSATTLGTGCYAHMFSGCVSLTSAPVLSATTLTEQCYWLMFSSCSSLLSAPLLPATTLTERCYGHMFEGCTNLTKLPNLSTTTLAPYCYQAMFENCYSLTSIPKDYFPVTTLAPYCYHSMFYGCRNISGAMPDLLATELTNGCYIYMFYNTKIQEPPILPATTLAQNCYYGMFRYCRFTSINLPATSLTPSCYYAMLRNCDLLTSITVGFVDWDLAEECTNVWLEFTGSGTGKVFYSPFNLDNTIRDGSHIPEGWNVVLEIKPLTFKAVGGTSYLVLSAVGDPDYVSLDASYDGSLDWHAYIMNSIINLELGHTISLSGNNDHFSKDIDDYYQFCMTGFILSTGNIQSLVNYNHLITNNNAYHGLFSGCTGLRTPPLLPATTLKGHCYRRMFMGCNSLSTVPILPATTLTQGCYWYMFGHCYALSTVPVNLLPAKKMATECYYDMFLGCTSLTAVPALPAITIADWCYCRMFQVCISLKTVPIDLLLATELAPNCYRAMFEQCTSLSSAPILPATELALSCYYCMFNDCTNLTSISANFIDWGDSSLNATYNWVSGVANNGTFYKSSLLSTIKDASHIPTNWNVVDDSKLTFRAYGGPTTVALCAVNSPDPITMYYSKNGGALQPYTINLEIILRDGLTVSFSGTTLTFSNSYLTRYQFVTNSNNSLNVYGNLASLVNGNNTISAFMFNKLFYECRNLKNVTNLILPYTTLASHCYYQMFQGCTALTTLPPLPATTLADYCYSLMFAYCTSLSTIPLNYLSTATKMVQSCYLNMFDHCTSLSTIPQNLLPATDLFSLCYDQMFRRCYNLTNIPNLPAENVAVYAYQGMFVECTSLTSVYLPATKINQGSYRNMFYGCTNLSSVEINFTDWGDSSLSATLDWLSAVADTGTFTCPVGLDTTIRDESHIPQNWNIVTK